ncbi:MAG: hypothetical protein K0R50_2543 [Eubacterium sp.]|nr:hypothetical protein [Eubacterium sp.]
MPEDKIILDKNTRLLYFYRIGCVFLFIMSIWLGSNYYLLSIIQFGILQMFITVIISNYLRFGKLEGLLNNNKVIDPIKKDESEKEVYPVMKDEPEKAVDSVKNHEPEKVVDPVKELDKFCSIKYPLALTFSAIIGILAEVLVFSGIGIIDYTQRPPILIGIFSMVLSFIFLVSTNLFKHNEESQNEYKMLSQIFSGCQWLSFITGVALIIRYFGFGQIERWVNYISCMLLILIFLEILFRAVKRLLAGSCKQSIELNLYVLPALLSGGNPINKLLTELENNTGISFRSTWTIRFIRHNLLMITLIIGIFFWGMTAFVQINPQQQGLLYNLGKIESRQPLLPGIHIKLPWPIQTVKIYPAYKINSFTVGYESEQRGDYLWTAGHNGEEYKLLLGGGKELVSINMQVFYKIGDLYEYTLQYDNPEEKLKAEAYRILLNETVTTDLNKLLSLNRSSFSKIVALKLQQISKDQRLGIEVTDVALTSIHPPTEIAREYQKIVSADIQKKTIITNAESYADSAIPKAEKDRNELIKVSQVESISRKGQANSDAAKYTYQKNAYQLGPGIYKEWKWLEVLENTLSGKKLFLLDKNLNLRKGSIWLDIRQKTEKSETENKLGPEEYSDTLEGDVKSEDSK